MADYRKMYTVLCAAVDDAITSLQRVPLARPYAERLCLALLAAENIYIETSPCIDTEEEAPTNCISDRSPDKQP